jgi:hypothetical protein
VRPTAPGSGRGLHCTRRSVGPGIGRPADPGPEDRPRNRDAASEMDPTQVITHRLPLAEAPHDYDIFKNKADGCEKVVLKP